MATDTDTDTNTDTKPDTTDKAGDKTDLGDAGKRALDAERKARREAEKALADVQDKLKKLEDADKSEVEKLRDEVARLTTDRDANAAKALRLEVASSKQLPPGLAKRLTGSTKEELEADAEELLAEFKPATGTGDDDDDRKSGPGSRSVKERLRGGSNPTEEVEEDDPRKVVERIPRL